MKKIAFIFQFLFLFFVITKLSAKPDPVAISWLDHVAPSIQTGVSWGVPWPEGSLKKGRQFQLLGSDGTPYPVQSWPMAYWPDGSVKWTGHATLVRPENKGSFQLAPVGKKKKDKQDKKILIDRTRHAFYLNTGVLNCKIPRQGSFLIDSLRVDERVVATEGELNCIIQQGEEKRTGKMPVKTEYRSRIEQVELEQNGPVRAVLRIKGKHYAQSNDRAFLTFDIRLYFYQGSKQIRMVHTFVFDGDEHNDFIRGLGVRFSVPMREEPHNRHIRFSGNGKGLWDEPVKPLTGRRRLQYDERNIYAEQIAGKRVPGQKEFDRRGQYLIDEWAAWNDFKLLQNSADGFIIQKRTNPNSRWIDAGSGTRSGGLVFAGDVSGGLAAGVKNFWQSYPSALEVKDARSGKASLQIWLWSPDAAPMDLRHYDTTAHSLEASYEDVQEGLSTPYGIARTSEIMLFAAGKVPSSQKLSQMAELAAHPPQISCSPQHIHQAGVFGHWSLPDRSTPLKAWIENQLDSAFSFYQLEVEQRNWYGFWDYGDVMHSYDPVRHKWRYDIGGFAWANTELMPDMWLWYSFLRTGRRNIFRMAEAMTRHTSEVDVYHKGKLAGLGSRHNVSHWGCGAKEVRISQAALKRFYYYLTTDERTGDLMREVARADTTMAQWDPLRLYRPEIKYSSHIRIGPDWLALVGNWLTEWERTGDDKWRDKIIQGIESYKTMPFGLFSGESGVFGYDTTTSKIYNLGKEHIGYSHLSVLMGGPEIAFELTPLLENETWNELWLQYCELFSASPEEAEAAFGRKADLGRRSPHYARMPAYAAMKLENKKLAKKAWDQFLHPNYGNPAKMFETRKISQPEVLNDLYEVPRISTNSTAQWCLNAIELLEMIGDEMPEEIPEEYKTKK